MRYKAEDDEPVGYRPSRFGERIDVRRFIVFWGAVLAVLAIGAVIFGH